MCKIKYITAILTTCLLLFSCRQHGDNQENRFIVDNRRISLDKYVLWQKEINLQVPDTLGILSFPQIRSENGLIYVWLTPPYLVGVFDTTGRFLKTIGANGFGPGELRRIQTFQVDSERNVYIVDDVTDEFYKFNVESGWICTKRPPKLGIMSFVRYSDTLVIFRRAYTGDHSFHIQICEIAKDSLRIKKELLPSSKESIRTRNIRSGAIAVNNKGTVLFSFFAGKKIYGITPKYKLFNFNIDPSVFKPSNTKRLLDIYKKKRAKGLMAEIFQNSRVLSLGFANDDIFLLSFATGRYNATELYVQFYSLHKRKSISRAIRVERPILSIGSELFASWYAQDHNEKNQLLLTIYKFKGELNDKTF